MTNKTTEAEWQAKLSPEQFRILRQKGTEMAGTGEYDGHFEKGVYNCAGCNTPLYKSEHKMMSHCGWPAYFTALPGKINRHVDNSFGMKRIEITCSNCDGHLGHVFEGEGYKNQAGERVNDRHCVNSVSLKFSPEDK
ncbi:hypothetical protein E3P99_01822 [Wallemia hederae]|uniref:Peptide-methionine (R)-S-oxide reductase n=1 Tax=Wallemia hederae TaxID=1540922 RepID=A0A4T0FNG1_9BASI|nr:hypothetical protein E3P99_01822 [Wallemia hederae]